MSKSKVVESENAPEKQTATGPEMLDVVLPVKKYKRRQVQALIDPKVIVALYKASKESEKGVDELESYIKSISDDSTGEFDWSVIDQVIQALNRPRLERDERGRVKVGPQTGQPIYETIPLTEMRSVSRIMDKIDEQLEPYEKAHKPIKTITISLIPKDALVLCKYMIPHFEDFAVVGKHVVESIDIFIDLKAKAEAALKKE